MVVEIIILFTSLVSQEPITSTLEGQYLMSEYRQFFQAGEKIANVLYCESLYYLCLLNSQRITRVSCMRVKTLAISSAFFVFLLSLRTKKYHF